MTCNLKRGNEHFSLFFSLAIIQTLQSKQTVFGLISWKCINESSKDQKRYWPEGSTKPVRKQDLVLVPKGSTQNCHRQKMSYLTLCTFENIPFQTGISLVVLSTVQHSQNHIWSFLPLCSDWLCIHNYVINGFRSSFNYDNKMKKKWKSQKKNCKIRFCNNIGPKSMHFKATRGWGKKK